MDVQYAVNNGLLFMPSETAVSVICILGGVGGRGLAAPSYPILLAFVKEGLSRANFVISDLE